MLTRITILLVALSLQACATCREHPVVCTAVAGVVVTGIALSATHHDRSPSAQQVHMHPLCYPYCAVGE